MSDEGPQAGWYDDPENPGQLRWWDGERWGDQRRPAPGSETAVDADAADPAGVVPTPAAAGAPGSAPVRVDTWLWQSIVATLLCCLPIGIVAIIFSAQAQSAINMGDHAKAQDRARLAKILTIVAVVVGVVVVGTAVLMVMAGVALGAGF
ncbi:MAG: CD225/dispanin family protein [Nitriliruptoraceae bacterium]